MVHFLTLAAQLMRRMLVDHARRRGYRKRGGEERPVGLDEAATVSQGSGSHLVAVDDALNARLEPLQGVAQAKLTLFRIPSSPARSSNRNSAARSAARVRRRITMTMP